VLDDGRCSREGTVFDDEHGIGLVCTRLKDGVGVVGMFYHFNIAAYADASESNTAARVGVEYE
jgi:hypothetical protein